MRLLRLFLTLAALTATLPALALPGELTAVERHCGNPQAESRETSQVTNHLQRTLIYNDLLLHFEPMEQGWSFTTAWHGHFPMTRGELESKLPCFRDAMNEVAANAPANTLVPADPAIAQQTAGQPIDSSFGIPHLWLIAILVVTLILFIFIPSARQRKLRAAAATNAEAERVYRQPDVENAVAPPPAKHIDPDLSRNSKL
jgi:hypothetical protein